MGEMDFEAWAQEYEEENQKIKKHIAYLKQCLKTADDSERRKLKQRILVWQSVARDNQTTALHLRERGREV